jgi:ADP-ribose pyrophosphatase YjhB (NUDIX family)
MEKENVQVLVVAGVVLRKDGKYLMIQEKKPEVYGLWNFPMGKVDEGETIEDAAVREAKEESGYDVELVRKIDIYQRVANEATKHVFEAKIVGGELRRDEWEILDAKWFEFEEIVAMKDKMRGYWVAEAIEIMNTNV